MNKQEIRKFIKERKRQMPEAEVELSSARVIRHLFSLPEYSKAGMVLSYMSVNQEVRTAPAVEKALKDGKTAFIPKTSGKRTMDFFAYNPDNLTAGISGIPEPADISAPALPAAEGTGIIILVPGLAFDRLMNRIGYGGGYYDTFLKKHPDITKIALCYGFQLFDKIPAEPHDVRMDIIITPDEVIRAESKKHPPERICRQVPFF